MILVCTILMVGCTATTKEELTESGLKRSDFQTEVNGEDVPRSNIEIPEEDVPKSGLPQTGLLWWPVPFLSMAGLLLLGMGYKEYYSGKRKDNEE